MAARWRRGGAVGRTPRPAAGAAGCGPQVRLQVRLQWRLQRPRRGAHESRPSPRRDQLLLDRAPLASLSAEGAEAVWGGHVNRRQRAAPPPCRAPERQPRRHG